MLSSFIKYQRKKHGYTQEELALKAGVGLRFIRELEQGKETIQLNKANQVLALFGFGMAPSNHKVDAYDVYWNFLNRSVKITLADKTIKYGMLLKEKIDSKENKICSWQFVSSNNAIKHFQKSDKTLEETILHSNIIKIELK